MQQCSFDPTNITQAHSTLFASLVKAGRVMFYYAGMGKAYVLDRLDADWRDEHFEHDLDRLISGEK